MNPEVDEEAPAAVLDTNTVLDWLVFADPGVAALAAAVSTGRVCWLACPRMRDELERTLAYPQLQKWSPDTVMVLSQFDAHVRMVPAPPSAPLILRCSDSDDQVFVDLAVHSHARWLVTRDRALLRLARRCRPLGLHILRPSEGCNDWLSPPQASAA